MFWGVLLVVLANRGSASNAEFCRQGIFKPSKGKELNCYIELQSKTKLQIQIKYNDNNLTSNRLLAHCSAT
jgi:hypothetical protein